MIYFIRSGEYVKIGYSDNPLGRLRQVQTGNPIEAELLAVCPGGKDDEAAIHGAFQQHRVSGEWFRATPRLDALIEKVSHDHPEVQLAPSVDIARRPKSVGGKDRKHLTSITLQDWLDILWQSASKAKGRGVNIEFVELSDSIGIRINGVVIKDGRPYLTATEVASLAATPAPQEEPTTP